jgi:hypothetical protein
MVIRLFVAKNKDENVMPTLLKHLTLTVILLSALLLSCVGGGERNSGETTVDLSKYKVTYSVFPGAYAENVLSNGWVYYAPIRSWKGGAVYISEVEAMTTYFDSAKILARENTKTGEIQTLNLSDISPIMGSSYTCGIDKDEQGNIYIVEIKGTIFKVNVDENNFSQSKVDVVILPFNEDWWYVNVLYYKGYIYITPMAHGFLSRIPVSDFSLPAVEYVDLTSIDPEATGYNGLTVDPKGFLWAAPNWNGNRRTGKVLRINSADFSLNGISIIDLALVSPLAQGYHGVCSNGDKVVFAPHWNEEIGCHANAAIIDINRPFDSAVIIDIGKYNDKIGATMNCTNIGENVLLFPYQKNTVNHDGGSYGIITVLNPTTLDLSFISLDIFPETKIGTYDGSFDGKTLFLSPYKSHVQGVESNDSRALKVTFDIK